MPIIVWLRCAGEQLPHPVFQTRDYFLGLFLTPPGKKGAENAIHSLTKSYLKWTRTYGTPTTSLLIVPEVEEDLWHAYNLIAQPFLSQHLPPSSSPLLPPLSPPLPRSYPRSYPRWRRTYGTPTTSLLNPSFPNTSLPPLLPFSLPYLPLSLDRTRGGGGPMARLQPHCSTLPFPTPPSLLFSPSPSPISPSP
ncbi:unnamed protein product [Closterium sp. Naga37s-1]|nr:unnamed protein product [Closterium sp. Naga37s-1]